MRFIRIKKYWGIIKKYWNIFINLFERYEKIISFCFVIIFGISSIAFGCSSSRYSKKQDEFINLQKEEQLKNTILRENLKEALFAEILQNINGYYSYFKRIDNKQISVENSYNKHFSGYSGVINKVDLSVINSIDKSYIFGILEFYEDINKENTNIANDPVDQIKIENSKINVSYILRNGFAIFQRYKEIFYMVDKNNSLIAEANLNELLGKLPNGDLHELVNYFNTK